MAEPAETKTVNTPESAGETPSRSRARPSATGFGGWQILLFVLVALVVAWFVSNAVGRGKKVEVAAARKGDAAEVVYATGIVEPVHWAKIAALQRKRIIELCKCEGQAVKAGEVLARLDDGEERALLRELQARIVRLRDDAERMRKLVERNVTSRLTYDEKLTQIREYEARIAAQEDRIDDLALKSPIDGVVLRRDGEVGEIAGIGANEALLWVGQPKPLQVIADVNEDDIGRVRPGQKVLLRHEGHVDKTLAADVERVTPKGDPETKTFRAYLKLPDDSPLMIGMSVEANIITREASAVVLVPAEAIVDNGVQVVEAERVARRAITVGIRGTRLVEVQKGLGVGDIVLSPFRPELEDGARVRFDKKPAP